MKLVDVTEKEFYAALYADKRDIMPTIVGGWSDDTGYTQVWQTNGRVLFGRTVGSRHRSYQLVGGEGGDAK